MESWVRTTKQRLTDLADEYDGQTAGLFVIFHGEVNNDSDGPVEVCVPIGVEHEAASVPGHTVLRYEPAHREAYVRVTKAQFEVPQILSAYEAVERWMSARGLVAIGSPREVYFADFDPHTAHSSDHVCDVACPIR